MKIRNVAVLGSGLMGRGIAYVAAVGGFETRVFDPSAAARESAEARIEEDFEQGVARGKLTEEQAGEARERLRFEGTLDATASEADFVIEAIPEDIQLKLETFGRLDALTRPGVVLATNTSALSVTEIAASTRRSERVIGMHFFNPVPRMKLVEVVRALETGDEAVEVTVGLAEAMGKSTVVVKDSAGFITSRINALIGNEAFQMLQEGLASAREIDTALKLGLNHPMGPFELVDMVGLDTRLAVLEFLHRSLGEKFRPAPLLVQHVKAGRLGRKVGRGVYDYGEDQ